MREQIRIWAGAAMVVALYMMFCSASEHRAAELERCAVVRCT